MRVIIACGGDKPGKREFLEYARRYDRIIAADGACNWLFSYGVTPHIVVGDMDSVKPAVLKAVKKSGAELITADREKDETDMMLAAMYASEELHADRAAIFGGLGGRLDHTLGNLQVMAYLLKRGVKPVLVDDRVIAELMKSRGEIVADVGTTVSIVPFMGRAVVTVTDGKLKYPLNRLELREDFPIGLSNVMESGKVALKIESGMVLVLMNRK